MKQVTRIVLTALCWMLVFFALMFCFFSFCAMSFNIAEWSTGPGRFFMFLGSLFLGASTTAMAECIEYDEKQRAAGITNDEDSDRNRHSHASY